MVSYPFSIIVTTVSDPLDLHKTVAPGGIGCVVPEAVKTPTV